jgi:glutamate-5-semialdehyde dehydrogenase
VLQERFKSAQQASRKAALLSDETINTILLGVADKVEKNIDQILSENKKDLDRMPETDPKYDRLKLTAQRIKDIASDLRNVSKLPSPLSITLEKKNTTDCSSKSLPFR